MRLFHILVLLFPSIGRGIPEIRWVEILNNNAAATTMRAKDNDSYNRVRSGVGGVGKKKTKSNSHGGTGDGEENDVQELYMQQSLDHFRLQDDRTFSQRYFYTDRFVFPHNNNNNPCKNENDQQEQQDQQQQQHPEFAFLCVGGEGPPLDKSVLVDSVHCTGDMIELARILYTKYNASVYLYALEHRYYGKSYPNCFNNASPVSNENLVYLSSRQALSDLSNFVTTINAEHFYCNNNNNKTESSSIRWVTFGGSYPGMLAAWARLQFPHLIYAAVSNSAPIQAQLDFPEYYTHVAQDLAYDKAGGSQACLDIIVQGHAELEAKVLDPTRHVQIARDFNLCNATSLENPKNVQLLLGDGVYGLGAQENDPSCIHPRCNIAKKCQALIDAKTTQGLTPYETLSWIVQQDQKDSPHQDCTVLDWQGTLDSMANPQQQENGHDGFRSWIWQTCTEFGFYQTCELYSNCPYGRGWHNVSQDLEMCEYAFDVHPVRVMQAVRETLAYYGGRDLKATRVLSVNGNVDPWSELALVVPDRRGRSDKTTINGNTINKSVVVPESPDQQDDPDRPTWMVPGASHHFWTHRLKETDSPEVVQARQVIYKTALGWLLSGKDGDDDDGNSIDRDHTELFGGRNNPLETL